MNKQNVQTVVLSIIFGTLSSALLNFKMMRLQKELKSDVIRVKRVELVDSMGHIQGAFELGDDGEGGVLPRLIMRDHQGRDSIEMGVGHRGEGDISFASEQWNQGAVMLGHLNLVDPQGADKRLDQTSGVDAWGLQVRSPRGDYTGVGFFNTGRPLATNSAIGR